MAYLNEMMVIGNVGSDPEMRFTPNGKPVCNFSLATNYMRNAADGAPVKETEWFDIVVWGGQAETCNQFLTKGQQVYAQGRLKTKTWTGNDGQNRLRLEIHASRVVFLDRKAGSSPDAEMMDELPS
ncbi:MAG: single-stranded DNA-binding protein [Dehalococcoidia bacterium]|nr:single-stranded DNA-binding protein [Dehalococcoidia bacterium]